MQSSFEPSDLLAPARPAANNSYFARLLKALHESRRLQAASVIRRYGTCFMRLAKQTEAINPRS
jgi:hypothetical protein